MVKKKTRLWAQVEQIQQCKDTLFGTGKKYCLQLVGVEKVLWVKSSDLSKGVAETYQADGSLAKNAKARVDRVYYQKQKEFLDQQVHILLPFTKYLCVGDCIVYALQPVSLLTEICSNTGPY